MNRLWVRLTLAFTLVVLIGIGAVALLVDSAIGRDFRSFVARNEIELGSGGLVDALTDHFEQHGNWVSVASIFSQIGQRPFPDRAAAPEQRGLGRFRPEILLADASGRIVFHNHNRRVNEQLSRPDRDTAIELQSGGSAIGYLVFVPGSIDALQPIEQEFIEQARRTLLLAALLSGSAGIVLGLALSRNLAQPLSRLASAARAIAAKDLTQRVEPSGTAEVIEVGRAFNEMAASLEKAEELRRNLVADVAHELRTPLTVLQGNLSALLDGVYPLEMSEIAKLYDESRLLHRLVDDLRELSQAESGQLHLDLQALDLSDVIRSAVEAFSAPAKEKQVSLTHDLSPNLPQVRADSERIAQVLRNLLTNALRHTPRNGSISISAAAVESWVEVNVSDTGEGIAPDDLPHVFDRFWRGDRSRARESGNTGLGLAIARHLIESHSGQIGAESQGLSDKGSRFWFKLPQLSS